MNKRKYRILSTLFLAILCTLSTMLTAWAKADGKTADAETGGVSRVITCGTGEASQAEAADNEAASTAKTAGSPKQGASLGIFTTTGYCNCEKCSGGHNLTYSGTVPRADHTLSADLSMFPLGTRLMIDGTVYTVEDMGSDVGGHKVDIYYGNHEDAVAHGMMQQEVFMVE